MNFTVNIRPDLVYYKEAYSEMVKSNGLRRFEPVFAAVMILAGVGLFYFDKTDLLGLFPVLFSGLGVFELIKVYTSRNKWIKDRIKSGLQGKK